VTGGQVWQDARPRSTSGSGNTKGKSSASVSRLRASTLRLRGLVSALVLREVCAKPVQQTLVPRRGDRADRAQQTAFWEDREKTKSDQGRCLQSARDVIVVAGANWIVKAFNLVTRLGRDSAYKPVAKWRHLSKSSSGPVLRPAICLRQGYENDIPFVHRPPNWVTEYSGSLSPYARARCSAESIDQSSRSVSAADGSKVTIKRAFAGKSKGSSSWMDLPS